MTENGIYSWQGRTNNGYIEASFMPLSQKTRQLPAMGLQYGKSPCTTNNLKGESPLQWDSSEEVPSPLKITVPQETKPGGVWFVKVTLSSQ